MTDFRTTIRRVRIKNGAELTVLHPVNALDIPQQLRRTADEIERGELHMTSMVAVAETGDGIDLFGWGNIDGLRAIGLLNLGTAKFMRDTLTAIEDGEGVEL